MAGRLGRILDTGLRSAAENMALDEVILEEVAASRSRPTLRFLHFSPPAALVGRHQEIHREIRTDFCRDRGIDVNRRLTGGGAIYFQTSALGWEFFGRSDQAPFSGDFARTLSEICRAGAQALQRLGLPAAFRPRNDIEVNGRKVSGAGGVYLSNAFMFQGTLLIENEMELFLKSLRVPVEKLKKREIESLQQRVCFVNDLLDPPPDMAAVKAAFAQAFADCFDWVFEIEGLTDAEERALHAHVPFYASPEWIEGRKADGTPAPMFWSLHQTPAGTLRTHLWLEPGGRRIKQALITGDFFCRPDRLALDLEAALKGVRVDRDAVARTVEGFFRNYDGEVVGIAPDQIVDALHGVIRRMDLAPMGLPAADVNEIFLVNMEPADMARARPAWLLLPYCSKKVDCAFRYIPDCGECGECEFDRMYRLARELDLTPYSIQSFEHLIEVMRGLGEPNGRYFIGSCCEAFYAKHQREMEATGARGLLVNLDSTTCYDLGKGMEAYVGKFENKTELNCALIEKMVRGVGRGPANV